MTIDLPRFIEELAEEGAAELGFDLATYVAGLICEDASRRAGAEVVPEVPDRFPEVSQAHREQALRRLLVTRAQRRTRERIIPMVCRGREDCR